MEGSDSVTEERKCFVKHDVEVYLHEFGSNQVSGRGEIIEIKKRSFYISVHIFLTFELKGL
jgi:hypothetical protein